MQAIKSKWAQHKAYQKLQHVWSEYKLIQPDKTDELQAKLSEFLEQFQAVHIEHKHVFGDLSDVLSEVLAAVQRELQQNDSGLLLSIAQKALSVTEIILQDEAQRKQTPALIEQMLAFLDKVNGDDAKKTVLRILVQLGQSQENKVALGQMDGYEKILSLLKGAKGELAAEIVKTMQHFLDSNDAEVAKAILIVQEKSKVSTLLSDISSLVRTEVGKVLQVNKPTVIKSEPVYHNLYPSLLQVGQLKKLVDQLSLDDTILTQVGSTQSDVTLLEGGLESLTKVLHDNYVDGQVKLGVLEMLIKLLDRSLMVAKFKELQGYELLFEYLACCTKDDDSIVLQLLSLLNSLLNVQGRNMDMLNMFVRLSISAENLQIRQGVLQHIHQLLINNPQYAAYLHQLGQIEYTTGFLRLALKQSQTVEDLLSSLRLADYGFDHVYGYLEKLVGLLVYEAVILQLNDCTVLDNLFSLLSACEVVENSYIQQTLLLVLKNIKVILEDFYCRRSTIISEYPVVDWSANTKIMVFFTIWLVSAQNGLLLSQLADHLALCTQIVGLLTEMSGAEFHSFEKIGGFRFMRKVLTKAAQAATVSNEEIQSSLFDCIDLIINLIQRFISAEVLAFVTSQENDYKLYRSQYVTECIQVPLLIMKELLQADAQSLKWSSSQINLMRVLSDASSNIYQPKAHLIVKLADCFTQAVSVMQNQLATKHLQNQFAQLGGVDVAQGIFDHGCSLENMQHSFMLQAAALDLMFTMIHGNESIKLQVVQSIGYVKLLNMVESTNKVNLAHSGPVWQFVLEMVTQGFNDSSVYSIVKSELTIKEPAAIQDTASVVPSTQTDQRQISQAIANQRWIKTQQHIKNPKMVFLGLQTVNKTSLTELSKDSSEKSSSVMISDQPSPQSKGSRHSRNASYNIDYSIPEDDDASQYRHAKSKSNSMSTYSSRGSRFNNNLLLTPIDAQSIGQPSKSKRNSVALSFDTRSTIKGSPSYGQISEFSVMSSSVAGHRASIEFLGVQHFIGLCIRDLGSAQFLMQFLNIAEHSETFWQLLRTLTFICEANPQNKYLLSQAGLTQWLILTIFSDEIGIVYEACKELLECIASHILSIADMKLMLEYVQSSNESLQMRALHMLIPLAQSIAPDYAIYLDGIGSYVESQALVNFPSNKVGYTLALWIKVPIQSSNDSGILTITDFSRGQSNQNTVELFLRRMLNSYRRGSVAQQQSKFCLCFQLQHANQPAETFLFDGYDFGVEKDKWKLLVFQQSRTELKLFVNGILIQSTSSMSFPTWVNTKDKAFQLIFGCRVAADRTRIQLEQTSTAKPGSWVQSWSQYWYPQQNLKLSDFDSQNVQTEYTDFLYGQIGACYVVEGLLQSQECLQMLELGCHSETAFKLTKLPYRLVYELLPSKLNDQLSMPSNHAQQTKRSPSQDQLNTVTALSLITSTLQKDLVDLNALLQSSSPIQATVMLSQSQRVNSPHNKQSNKHKATLQGQALILACTSIHSFIVDIHGFKTLLTTLSQGPAQELAGIEFLKTLLQRSQLARIFVDHGYMHALFYVLQQSSSICSVDVNGALLQLVTLNMVLLEVGMVLFADLSLTQPQNYQQQAFDSMVQYAKHGTSIDFKISLSMLQETAAQASCYKLLQKQSPWSLIQIHQIIDYICYNRKIDDLVSYDMAKALLQRCLNDVDVVSWFNSVSYMNIFISLLQTRHQGYQVTLLAIIQVLALHQKYINRNLSVKFDGIVSHLKQSGLNRTVLDALLQVGLNDGKTNRLYVECFRSVFELLRTTSDDSSVRQQVFSSVLKQLSPFTMDAIWEQPWLDWVYPLVENVQAAFDTMKIMLVHDLNKKYSMVIKLKGNLHDSDIALRAVVQSALDYVQESASSLTVDFVNNFSSLWTYFSELFDYHDILYVQFVKAVNTVMSQCHNLVRDQAKSQNWMAFRDTVLLNSVLIQDLDALQVYFDDPIICQCLFHSQLVAQLLLRMILRKDLVVLRESLYDLISQGNWNGLVSEELLTTISDRQKFNGWLSDNSPDVAAQKVITSQQLEVQYQVLYTSLLKSQEKQVIRRSKREKLYKERLIKQQATNTRQSSEFKAKCIARLEKAAAQHQAQQDELRMQRQERQRVCQKAYAALNL